MSFILKSSSVELDFSHCSAQRIGDKVRAAIRTSKPTMTLNGQKNGEHSITALLPLAASSPSWTARGPSLLIDVKKGKNG